jgi:hypothetical protein
LAFERVKILKQGSEMGVLRASDGARVEARDDEFPEFAGLLNGFGELLGLFRL